MTNNDTTSTDFTNAARIEAERRTRPPGISGQTLPSMEQLAERDGYRRGFADAADWARERLAEREVTDAEVEAAARAVRDADDDGCIFCRDDETPCSACIKYARAALSAARKA